MRRILAFLLLLTFLPISCLCETGADRLKTLDIISQLEDRLTGDEFEYRDMLFSIAGCLPACITNGLLALLGSPETDSPALLQEVCRNFRTSVSDTSQALDRSMFYEHLSNLRENTPILHSLTEKATAIVKLSTDTHSMVPADIIANHAPTPDDHPLLVRKMNVSNNWSWVLDMAGELCRLKHPDARFVLCIASAGTEVTKAPLASGANGHYLTLYFTAQEFHEEGTFYLLDSYPRALEGDIYGLDEHYPSRYPFLKQNDPFGRIYDATRLTDPVLMFTLKDSEQDRLTAADESSRATIRLEQIETMQLFSTAYFILYIP